MDNDGESSSGSARVEFCGEVYDLDPDRVFGVGREGDLVIDSNPFLHRRFLELRYEDRLWWLANVGSQLSATVADVNRTLNAWISPGARIPVVFPRISVWFTAGPTTYELEIVIDSPPFGFVPVPAGESSDQTTTMEPLVPTPEQLRVVLALSEPALLRTGSSTSEIPTSADAARRLGWTLTKFNRKLDALCDKLDRQGVRGLHGGPDQLAMNRRARLVEYALSTRLVTKGDLAVLDDRPIDVAP